MEQPARSCLAMAGGSNTLTLAQTDHQYSIFKRAGLQ